MLSINKLSFWEKELYFKDVDFMICGAGIVGYSAALEIRAKFPDAKIVILERGYLPTGASTKNAGFTCFGSPSEILDDLSHSTESEITTLVARRYEGLQRLLKRCGEKDIDYLPLGSFELFTETDRKAYTNCLEKIDFLNQIACKATGIEDCYSPVSVNQFPFAQTVGMLRNKGEGQINTGLMMHKLHQLAVDQSIHVLFGIEITEWESYEKHVIINSSIGEISCGKLIIATNGLSSKILPEQDISPARAQVIITRPIQNLPFQGTFHYDAGYYYFRNIGNRVLLGGGRNLDMEGESTDEFGNTSPIISALTQLLSTVILPRTPFEIEHQWSGIMGVGKTKQPIVKKISPLVTVGIRMGGMGVALGSLIGKELADLQY